MKLVVLLLLLGCSKRTEQFSEVVEISPEAIFRDVVLEQSRIRTAADLVPGAPPRALVIAHSFELPHGGDRTTMYVVGLAPGEPGQLPVPLQLEGIRFSITKSRESGLRSERLFARDDLITAVRRALADEGKAFAAAEAALIAARVELPRATWKAALEHATYDARLPASSVAGEPSWSFLFEPWDDRRGWNQVVLDAKLGVTLVNGKRP